MRKPFAKRGGSRGAGSMTKEELEILRLSEWLGIIHDAQTADPGTIRLAAMALDGRWPKGSGTSRTPEDWIEFKRRKWSSGMVLVEKV